MGNRCMYAAAERAFVSMLSKNVGGGGRAVCHFLTNSPNEDSMLLYQSHLLGHHETVQVKYGYIIIPLESDLIFTY